MADYTRDDLITALRNAHNAGDTAAAQAIALRIQALAEPTAALEPAAPIAPNPGNVEPAVDPRPDWVRRQDEDMGGSSMLPQGMPLNVAGENLSGFLPGVGVANAAFGKKMAFSDPDSMLPTGVEDTPTLMENWQKGNKWTAAGQALGAVPDIGYAAKAAGVIGHGAAKVPGTIGEFSKARERVPLTSDRVANPLDKSSAMAFDELKRAFKAGDITPEQFSDEMAKLGEGAMPADVPVLAALHAKVSRMPGAPGAKASAALIAREESAPDRLSNIIGETISNKPYYETKEALKAVGETAVDPMYKRAFGSKQPVYDDETARLLADPKVHKNLRESVENAMSMATARGETPKLSDWAITGWNESGDPIMEGVPNMRTLHAARRAMDNKIETYREPVTRKINYDDDNVKALVSLRSALTRKMHELGEKNPETGVALIKEADAESEKYKKLDNALDSGYGALKNDPEVNSRIVNGSPEYHIDPMTAEQREMAQRGLARNLMEQVTGKGAKSATDLFQNEENLLRMRPLFESQKAFDQFKMSIVAEARKAATTASGDVEKSALRTGKDASRLGEPSQARDAVGTAADLATSSKMGKLRRAGSWIADKFEPDQGPIGEQLADFLYTTDAEKRARVMSRMRGDAYLDTDKAPPRLIP